MMVSASFILVLLVASICKPILKCRVPLVTLVLLAHLVKKLTREILANLARKDRKAHRDLKDHLDCEEPREYQGHLGQWYADLFE